MEKARKTLRGIIIFIPLVLIKVYQKLISPMIGPSCRFHPSCSYYAVQALKQHGLLIGGWLSIKRILKCHPLHPGGVDHVPPKPNKTKHQ